MQCCVLCSWQIRGLLHEGYIYLSLLENVMVSVIEIYLSINLLLFKITLLSMLILNVKNGGVNEFKVGMCAGCSTS